jgi:hypothetical protein
VVPVNLYDAVVHASADDVATLAAATDVDQLVSGRTPLWRAVFAHKPDNARILVAAGADPHRPMMVTEARRLAAALGDLYLDGLGLACVAGIDVAEAIRRLDATAIPRLDIGHDVVGATDVPGGVVIAQPWGYRPHQPDMHERLSVGTVCYGLYKNPKSGSQGSVSRNGEITGWDLFPGGGPDDREPADQILLAYLYQHQAIAYACAFAGLRLIDARAVTGEPDMWLRLPSEPG